MSKNNVMEIDRYEPNWKRRCCVCDEVPTVNGMKGEKVTYSGEMCGVCTWGEAAMADPDLWNKAMGKEAGK